MTIKQRDLLVIFRKTNGRCFYCNKTGEVIDHFFPKQKHKQLGLLEIGVDPDRTENLFLSCASCNSKKSDKWPEEFTGLGFWVWRRYLKTNHRVGILTDMTVNQLLYG